MAETLLWICSAQNDFFEPGGALAIPGSSSIRPALARLLATARERRIPRLHTVILREEFDPEIVADSPNGQATFPPHCLPDTPGQAEIQEAAMTYGAEIPRTVPSRRGVSESLDFYHEEVLVEVPGFDPWAHPQLGTVFEVIAPRRVALCGLPGELSVAEALGGLLERAMGAALIEDAVAFRDAPAREALVSRWRDAVPFIQSSAFPDSL